MARFLALEIDAGRMNVVVGSTIGSKLKLEQALSWTEDALLTLVNAADLGMRLRQRLEAAKIAPGPVIVALGRDRLLLKDVKYPPVPPHEEPALIRFQVVKELTENPDEMLIDYVPTIATATDRKAMAVIVKKDIQKAIDLVVETAGLKLIGTTPRMFGLVAALEEAIRTGSVAPPERAAGSVAILARGEKGGEFVVIRDGAIQMARAVSAPALNSESALLNEMKRNLAIYSNQSSGNPIGALYLTEVEGMPGSFAGRLREGLTIPVMGFDPIPGLGGIDTGTARGGFAGLVGLLALRAKSSELPINFVQPREPKQPRDPGMRMFAVIGMLMASVVIGAVVWSMSSRAGLDRQLEALNEQKMALDRDLITLEQQGKRIKAVDDWTNRGIVWLDELYEVTSRIKDIDKTRIDQFTGKPLEVTKNSDSKYVASMTMKVLTEDSKFVESLVAAFVQDEHYKVAPKEASNASNIRNNRLNQAFNLRADLMHQKPEKYDSVLDTKRPVKPKSSSDGGSGFFGGGGGMFNPFGGQ